MALTKITPQMFDTSATAHDLNVDNGTFVVDGSASRVGIGTSTPSTLLDVNGTATATTFVGALTGNVTGNVTGTVLTAAQPNITSLSTLTALNVSGNVGLGFASSPSYPLEVQSGGVGTVFRAGTSFFSVDATGSASSPSLVFNGDTDTGFYRSAGDTIKFASAGVDRLTLTSSLIVDVGSTFNLAVGINGKLSLNDSTYAGWIQSNGSVRIDIDNDNNQTDRAFVVSKNNGATSLLTILENTAATFAGAISVGSTTVFNNSGVLQSAALSGTYSNPVNFSHSSLELSGHMFFNEFSSGRHYIHFKTAASTNQIDWRIQTNSANNTIHSWTNTLASFATPIAVPVGSASAPSLTFSGDTNTGLFRAASDQLGFAAAGAQQALFLSNRYLFGTTVSGVYYDASNVYTPTMLLKSSHSGQLATLALINGDNAYGSSIDFAHVTSNNSIQQRFAAIVGVSDNRVSSAGSGHLSFRTMTGAGNITEHMRITAGGTVSIGADGVSSGGGNRLAIDTAVNAAPVTSGTTQTGGALRLRGGDNAVLDFGLNSVNTWIQATDKVNLANGYNIALNPNGGKVGVGLNPPYAQFGVYRNQTDPYTVGSFLDQPTMELKHPATTGGYNGIRYTNTSGNYEWFAGTNQNESQAADFVFQGYDRGGGTYREMARIHDSGSITAPQQVGFRARGQRAAWVNGDTTIWSVLTSATTGNASSGIFPIGLTTNGENHMNGYNIGNCYNVSNGRFTTPIEGKYQVYGSLYCNKTGTNSTSYMHLLVYVNSQQINEIYTIGAHNHNFAHSFSLNFSTVLFLEVNDYVDWRVYTYDSSVQIYGAHCSLGAHLLS